MNRIKSAEDPYYDYQTQARGLVDAHDLRKKFLKLAPWYKKLLHRYLPKDLNATILDIPCGYGNILYFFREYGYKNAVGYDLDPEQVRLSQMLDLAALEGNAFTVLKDENKLYDCIISVDFLEHMSRDNTLYFLDLCCSRLKSGGTVIVRTPCADGLFGAHDRYNDLTHQ